MAKKFLQSDNDPKTAYLKMLGVPDNNNDVVSNVSSNAPSTRSNEDQVHHLPLDLLDDYAEHTFEIGSDEELISLSESIRNEGLDTPIIVRPKEQGRYEIIAGHRRTAATRLAGLDTIRAFVRDLDDYDATSLMVRTNLKQRQHIKHSEKAWSYRKMMEAIKRRAGRPQINGSTHKTHLNVKSKDVVASEVGISAAHLMKYIRLTYLNTELLGQVDKSTLAFATGVTLSYMLPEEQECLINVMALANMKPSEPIANQMKSESQRRQAQNEPPLTEDDLNDIWIMSGQPQKKAKEIKNLKLPFNIVRRYYPENMTQDVILQDAIQAIRIYNIVKKDPDLLHELSNR